MIESATGEGHVSDGSTVRTPGVGVYLADPKPTNMENYGVQSDIRVDNLPEGNLAGRDRQLEAAVEELLRQREPASETSPARNSSRAWSGSWSTAFPSVKL